MEISSIVQDKDGAMWLGSELGLYKYDGYSAINYNEVIGLKVEQDNPGGLRVIDLLVDHSGLIWISTLEGVYVFDKNAPLEKAITLCPIAAITGNNFGDYIAKMEENHKKEILLYSNNDHCYLYQGEQQFQKLVYSLQGLPQVDKIQAIFYNINGADYLLTSYNEFYEIHHSDSISAVTFEGIKFSKTTCFSNEHSIKKGMLWATTNQSLVQIDLKQKKASPVFLSKDLPAANYQKIMADVFGNIWLSTDKIGLIQIKPKEEKIFNYSSQLGTNEVHTLYDSKDGNIWVASHKDLFLLNNQNNFFIRKLDYNLSIENILPISSSEVFLKTDQGFQSYNMVTGALVDHKEIGRLTKERKTVGLQKDGANQILLGISSSIKIHAINTLDYSYETVFDAPEDYAFKCFLKTANQAFWIGTEKGLFNAIGSDQLQQFKDPTSDLTLSNKHILCIKQGLDGKVLVGTKRNGLFVIKEDRIVNHFYTSTDNNEKVFLSNVNDIEENEEGFWAATREGLIQIQKEDKKIKLFQGIDGLVADTLRNLKWVDEKLWISTSSGLATFDPIQERFKSYFPKNKEVFQGPINYLPEVGLLFGTRNGFLSIDPKLLGQEIKEPRVFLSSFTIDNDSVSLNSRIVNFNDEKVINVYYYNELINFQFALSEYSNPSANQFSYRLRPADQDFLAWSEPTNSNSASFKTDLKPGNYFFEVKAIDSRGEKAQISLQTPLVIHEAFYKKAWFIFLCFAAFTSIVVGTLSWIYNRNLERALADERLRTKIASDLHDEVGGTLSKIRMSAELMQAGIIEPKKEELDNIADACREAVGMMSDVVWAIDSRKETMGDLLNRMKDHVQSLLGPKNIQLEFTESGFDLSRKVEIDLRQNILRIFKEAVNNISKHSDADQVWVRIHKKGATFRMSIKDNGQSASKDKTGSGFGMKNMELRAKTIGGTLEVRQEKGFEIILVFPKFA